jgi:hypothetical protein
MENGLRMLEGCANAPCDVLKGASAGPRRKVLDELNKGCPVDHRYLADWSEMRGNGEGIQMISKQKWQHMEQANRELNPLNQVNEELWAKEVAGPGRVEHDRQGQLTWRTPWKKP